MSFLELTGACETGLIFGFVALGIWLTFRILNFADLTVDGSFSLGASVSGSYLVLQGGDPWVSLLVSFALGAAAGLVTAVFSEIFRIPDILSGILTMNALYSLNLRIMGSSNLGFLNEATVYTLTDSPAMVLVGISLAGILLLSLFFATNAGLACRCAGINPEVSRANGISVKGVRFFILSLSNGLIAVAGALFCQREGYADVSMGTGTVIIGLASVVLGETFFPSKRIPVLILRCFVGSVLYRVAVTIALNSSGEFLKSSDLSLLTTCLVAGVMVMPLLRKKIQLIIKPG